MFAELNIGKKIAFGAVSLVLILVFLELLSFLGIELSRFFLDDEIRRTSAIFREQSHRIREFIEPNINKRTVFDSVLGWRYRMNHNSDADQINSQGLRSSREYSPAPGPGVIRVAAFGNSFVYCNEVVNQDAWPALLERMYPHFEVLNYGVGGYGADQAYLRFIREGMDLSPHIVIIGFAPVNLRRVVSVYRRFISNREYPLVKPRFVFDENGNMLLLPSPIQRVGEYERYLRAPRDIIELGRNDYWYRSIVYENPLYDWSASVRLGAALWIRVYDHYLDSNRLFRRGVFNKSSTAFKIQAALVEKFTKEVRAAGALALVVVFPDKDSIIQAASGQPKIFDPLLDYLKMKGFDHVDLSSAFLAADVLRSIDQWFMPGGHYSPLGNTLVATWLGQEIQRRAAQSGLGVRDGAN